MATFPEARPWSLELVLGADFLPEAGGTWSRGIANFPREQRKRPCCMRLWSRARYGRIRPTSPSMLIRVPKGSETCCSHSSVSWAT